MKSMQIFVALATGSAIKLPKIKSKPHQKTKPIKPKKRKTLTQMAVSRYKKVVVYWAWRDTAEIAHRLNVSTVAVSKFLRKQNWVESRRKAGTGLGLEWRQKCSRQ